MLTVTWIGRELLLLLVRHCWDSKGCSWVHSPMAEQAVPLPVSLLLEPNMVGQSSRKKNTLTFICVTTNSCWYCFKNGIKRRCRGCCFCKDNT